MIALPWAAFVRLLLLAVIVGAFAALYLGARTDHAVVAGDPPSVTCSPASPAPRSA